MKKYIILLLLLNNCRPCVGADFLITSTVKETFLCMSEDNTPNNFKFRFFEPEFRDDPNVLDTSATDVVSVLEKPMLESSIIETSSFIENNVKQYE